MAFYATARTTTGRKRTAWLAGPFNRHGDAVRASELARRYLREHAGDFAEQARIPWLEHGTARARTPDAVAAIGAGVLNERLGISPDR